MIWGSVTDEGGLISGGCSTYVSHQRDKPSFGVLLFKPPFLMTKENLVPENKSSAVRVHRLIPG